LIHDIRNSEAVLRVRPRWRTYAEPWQLELSKHGRVVDDQPGDVTVMAECVEMARQLLAEWLTAHPGKSVEEPPSVGIVN
jgi:hypothetical protein